MQKKLVRDPNNKMIAGVCSGIADYFGWDATWVRAAFGISLLFGGTGFFVYIVLWIVMPEGPIYPVPQQWGNPNAVPNATEYPGAEYEGNPYRASEYPANSQASSSYPDHSFTETTFTETTFTEGDENR